MTLEPFSAPWMSFCHQFKSSLLLYTVYLDDILVSLHTPCYHIEHVKIVLSLLRGAMTPAKLTKCNFSTGKIDYIGHVIRHRQLEIATHTSDAMKGLKPATNITKPCSFFGLYHVFRRSFTKIAHIAAPPNKKLKQISRCALVLYQRTN